MTGWIGALWGLGAVTASIVNAVARLAPAGWAALDAMEPAHWIALAIWVPAMVLGEGYLGFHRSFSRMVAARLRHLRDHPRVLHVVFAPLFCVGLVHATRMRQLRSGALIAGIVILIVIVRALPQPWRGVVDVGVVAGLAVGLVSMLLLSARSLAGEGIDHPADLPPDGAGRHP